MSERHRSMHENLSVYEIRVATWYKPREEIVGGEKLPFDTLSNRYFSRHYSSNISLMQSKGYSSTLDISVM
ncbi:unnamed protein product [marine sediment metagenome]|uniref:Uncharacterized protein n=1 Tax=marine sediment metagenome TaxID=412755 RepID=X0XZW6_9ZZZZ